ncbi:MAG: hypothetical protein Q9205_007208 [Flavoplaca limonia]
MMQIYIIAFLALLGRSFAIPQNIPGGRRFPEGSRGDRAGHEPGSSAAEKDFINEELLCSGDMSTPYNETCWNTLKVAEYIVKWEQEVTKCPQGNNTCIQTGCKSNEPWSSCFLRLATGTPDYNCTQINIGHCTLEGFPLKDPNSLDMPQNRYVVRNLFAINNFFVNWYAAMQFATSAAVRAVPKIIATLDPEKEADTTLEAILTALTIGLPFLSLPAVGALVPAATGAVGTLFVTALQQAPSVTEAIWKSDDESTQVVQMGELASELDQLNGKVGEMLDRGLAIIMTDVSTFAKFASSGSFSGPDAISIPKETAKLDLAFKAHLVTKAMSANDWWVYYGPPDNADGTWSNSTMESNAERYVCNTTPKDNICDLIDSHGVPPMCQPEDWSIYTSNVTHRAYYPSQQQGRNDLPSAHLLHAIADNEWGSLEAMMDGAYDCEVNKGGPSPGSAFQISEDGRFSLTCLSQLHIVNGCPDVATKGWQEGCNWFLERHKDPPLFRNGECV